MRPALGQISILFSRSFVRLVEQRRSWDRPLRITEEVKEEALFWLNHFDKWNGKVWGYSPLFRITVWTDALGHAWGGWVFFGVMHEARGALPDYLIGTDSTLRELYAYLATLRSLVDILRGKSILIKTDSQVGVAIMRKGGHMRPDYNVIIRDIFFFCVENQILLVFEWISRVLNKTADGLSKITDKDDYAISPVWFARISQRCGPFKVDRFASDRSAQLPVFNSRWYCPGTSGVNAFSLDWHGVSNWVHAPFSLIHTVLMNMCYCNKRLC
eukprot:Lithocolla_globosa_v1_NODE_1602_length_2456_cov_9.681383.p1 type:complete len:271 gc:universal NODE_1602_length_2456_cov_9.681383:2168-1356(-)